MASVVVPIVFRPEQWCAGSRNLRSTAACNRRSSVVSVGLGSDFRGVPLATSSPQQSDRVDRDHQRSSIEGRTAENDYSADDESWATDFRVRMEIGEDADNTASVTWRIPPSPVDSAHWRDFRARLCSSEMGMFSQHESEVSNSVPSKHWAHRILSPEVGCVLVATNKLRHHAFLNEAVVLLLGSAENQYHGIILNKIMSFPAHTLQGVNQNVLLDLAGCPKYVGGPLISPREIHVLSTKGDSRGFRTLVPGLSLGGDAAVQGLISRVNGGKMSVQEYNLYIGQMGWEASQFFAEVLAFEWWDMVACSSNVILDTVGSGDLWPRLRSLYLAED